MFSKSRGFGSHDPLPRAPSKVSCASPGRACSGTTKVIAFVRRVTVSYRVPRSPGISILRAAIVVTVAIALAVLIVISLVGRTPEDPLFEGRRFSQWLESVSDDGLTAGGVGPDPAMPRSLHVPGIRVVFSNRNAYRAIQSVGADAIPLLSKMIGADDTRLRRALWEFTERHRGTRWVRRSLGLSPPTGWKQQVQALAAFGELGPRASGAIPRIIPMLDDPDRAQVAVVALLLIQPQRERDILRLTNVLRISRVSASGAAADVQQSMGLIALSTFGARAARAKPVLLACLQSTNTRVQAAAAIALQRIGAPAAEVVPLVMSHLPMGDTPLGDSSLPDARRRGAALLPGFGQIETERVALMNLWTLARYGPKARSALPALSNLLTYPDTRFRQSVAGVVREIEAGASAP